MGGTFYRGQYYRIGEAIHSLPIVGMSTPYYQKVTRCWVDGIDVTGEMDPPGEATAEEWEKAAKAYIDEVFFGELV